jgi:hypothetical protein
MKRIERELIEQGYKPIYTGNREIDDAIIYTEREYLFQVGTEYHGNSTLNKFIGKTLSVYQVDPRIHKGVGNNVQQYYIKIIN